MPSGIQISRVLFCAIALALVGTVTCGFFYQSRIPSELVGKWRLRGVSNSKLVGSLEIRADGKYTYNVIPNYREVGQLKVSQQRGQNQLDLTVVNTKAKTTEITRGIFVIRSQQLQLHLGKKNESRPSTFTPDTRIGILWLGSR